MGIRTIRAVTPDKIVVAGGDGQVILFSTLTLNNQPQLLMKTTLFGSVHGLSASPDGLQLLTATDKGFIYRVRVSDFS